MIVGLLWKTDNRAKVRKFATANESIVANGHPGKPEDQRYSDE